MKIVYLAERVIRAQEMVHALRDNDIFCELIDIRHFIGFPQRPSTPWVGKYHLLKIHKKISENSPNLIISDTVSLVSLFALFSKFIKSLPFCVRLRGNFWEEVRQRRLEQKTVMNFLRTFMRESLGTFCLKKSDAIFPVCNYLSKVVLEHLSDPNKIFSVFNGVDTSRFNLSLENSIFKQKYDLENQTLIVCVSNFNFPEKVRGITYFLPIISSVLKAYRDVTFVIVGGGLYYTHLENEIKRCKLSSRVIMTGFLKDVEYAYAAADIIFYPSFHDSLPTVLLEASACGKPIIASKIGGIPEIILNYETGLLFTPYDKKVLINYFRMLLDDKLLRKRLGTNARKRIEEYFNWSKVGKRLSEILHSLITS